MRSAQFRSVWYLEWYLVSTDPATVASTSSERTGREAQEAAWLERRQTELSRQLSTFLADASLALDASDSLEEMLRLVAEQARELVGAECCVATVAMNGQPRTAEAVSFAQAEPRWAGFVRWLDLFAIYRFIRMSGGR